MDIRFEDEPRKGKSPTTRLYVPNTEGDAEESEAKRPVTPRKRARAAEESIQVSKPEMKPASRIGLILCGFLFAGMVLFALTGYERISRAYADINTLNDEIEATNLRIIELEAAIECAVTIQEAQAVAEANGMQYPDQSQYVAIGSALPFSGSAPTQTTPDSGAGGEDTTGTETTPDEETLPDGGENSTGGGSQPDTAG